MPHSERSESKKTAEPVENATTTTIRQPIDSDMMRRTGNREIKKPVRESGLRGKVVVITGAGAGIGRATALRFAEEGAKVSAWDVTGRDAGQLESQISQAGGEGCFQAVNVTDPAEIEVATQCVLERWQRIDVLINNAGIVRDAQLVKWNGGSPEAIMSEEAWDAVINVNLKGVFLTTRAVVPHMIKGGGGVIVSAASVVGLTGNFGQTNYVASKAGVIGMTRTWARELGKHNIRVNAIAPGFIATEMIKAMPEKVLQAMVARTPLGRAGTPEDIANAYAWLASDQASFVHGAVISVDGGVVIGT